MQRVHDVFPADKKDDDLFLSLKKLKKKEGEFALLKDMLVDFDGDKKTMQLEEKKREFAILHKWIRMATSKTSGIEFSKFELVIAKIRQGFM